MSPTKKAKTAKTAKSTAAKKAAAKPAVKKLATTKPIAKAAPKPAAKPVKKTPAAKPAEKKVEPASKKVAETPSPKAETPKKVKPASPRVQILGHGVGRRKTAIARVWLRRGKGAVKVNGKDSDSYFDTDINRREVRIPFEAAPIALNYDIEANVVGGGKCGQAGAVKLGIARALVGTDEELRSALKKYQLLSVDSRRKERKKYGQKAARRKFQFVKR